MVRVTARSGNDIFGDLLGEINYPMDSDPGQVGGRRVRVVGLMGFTSRLLN